MDHIEIFLALFFVLAPLGSLLLLVLLIGSLTPRFGPSARRLLLQGAIGGGVCAALMALVFVLEPDLSMPGPGNYAMMLGAFLAGLTATVIVMLAARALAGAR